MRHRVFGPLLLLLAVLASADLAAASAPTVIMLSLDGVRADYPDRTDLPGFSRLEREGARAEGLVPPFPPITFPSHVTLATGASVDRHGIVANDFRDPDRGRFHYVNDATWQKAEPIWVAAERQGVPSAIFFWVGSEGPWHGTSAGLYEHPFDSEVPDARKVDRILEWLDLSPPRRPRLIVSWWHGADAPGHRFGPDSPAVVAAMVVQDAQLVRLLAGLDARGLWDETTLVVVSDHGMAAVTQSVSLEAALGAKGIDAEVLASGGIASIHLADLARRDEAREVIAAIPGVELFAPDALPAQWRYGPAERLGDLVAVTAPPRAFREKTRDRVITSAGRRTGAHGYDASRADMRGIFFAMGRGVAPATKLGAVSSLDVAPTVARLLGIEPPRDAEGRAIEALAPPAADVRP
ncbi:MAG: alkaline phosphatase family protein [Deltaproteobacteria bacterium]|nr:alkaline phosphatase family protein [Deltaproteobacteria bacterium]